MHNTDAMEIHVRDRLDLLPLRQLVRTSGEAQSAFARQGLLDLLSRPSRYRIARCGGGGKIFAAGELALAQAQALLASAYGASDGFGEVTVHSYADAQGTGRMVPIMFLRVDAARAYHQALQRVLHDRCIEAREVELQRERVVIRVEASLSRLLGLPQQLDACADGTAHMMSWLVRYAPAPME